MPSTLRTTLQRMVMKIPRDLVGQLPHEWKPVPTLPVARLAPQRQRARTLSKPRLTRAATVQPWTWTSQTRPPGCKRRSRLSLRSRHALLAMTTTIRSSRARGPKTAGMRSTGRSAGTATGRGRMRGRRSPPHCPRGRRRAARRPRGGRRASPRRPPWSRPRRLAPARAPRWTKGSRCSTRAWPVHRARRSLLLPATMSLTSRTTDRHHLLVHYYLALEMALAGSWLYPVPIDLWCHTFRSPRRVV
mmetsp:Transcript_48666/g.139084  ORF Transcript_48666/g.139084 Transcript_48666/m.139084 type:complete len:246 (+) Transcript_48666:1649-2386(+)